jgi:3-oxoacyl-[acyl-carrier protein] reductase
MRLKGKTAIVTGAAQGFGYGIAETFIREGARVCVMDINKDKAREAAKALGRKAFAIGCDVAKSPSVNRAFARAVEKLGRVDILVNNAGISHRNQPMLQVGEAEFDRLYDVNVKSIYLTAVALVPHFRQHGGGVIINIGSTAGIRPRPGLTWYNGTKGAVNLLSKSMAVELAPDRIRVCCIAPVAGETPLLATFMGEDTPEKRAMFRLHPAGPPLDTRRHRECCALSGIGRSIHGDRQRAGSGWRPLHLRDAAVTSPVSALLKRHFAEAPELARMELRRLQRPELLERAQADGEVLVYLFPIEGRSHAGQLQLAVQRLVRNAE